MKLIINSTSDGFGVWDADKMTRLDLFPNTEEGRDRLVDFLAKFVYSRRPKKRSNKKSWKKV